MYSSEGLTDIPCATTAPADGPVTRANFISTLLLETLPDMMNFWQDVLIKGLLDASSLSVWWRTVVEYFRGDTDASDASNGPNCG